MSGGSAPAGATHTFVAHRAADELTASVVPFVRAGLAAGRPVYVNVAHTHLALLQDAVGGDAQRVTWTDTDEWIPHPARRLRAIEDLLAAEAAAGRQVSFVGTCAWPTGPAPLVREWERFDAALHDVLVEHAASMLCVCDATIVPPDVVERCRGFHPELGVDPLEENPAHVAPAAFLAESRASALPIPEHAARLVGQITPGTARRFLHDVTGEDALAHAHRDELTVVLSELVTNSCQAGSQTITVAFWRDTHGVALQVDDDGTGFEAPLAGYRRPPAESEGGRGVWIARQLADVVEVVPRAPGMSVRVHLYDPEAIIAASARATTRP